MDISCQVPVRNRRYSHLNWFVGRLQRILFTIKLFRDHLWSNSRVGKGGYSPLLSVYSPPVHSYVYETQKCLLYFCLHLVNILMTLIWIHISVKKLGNGMYVMSTHLQKKEDCFHSLQHCSKYNYILKSIVTRGIINYWIGNSITNHNVPDNYCDKRIIYSPIWIL